MEKEDLQQLVTACLRAGLSSEAVDAFCAKHVVEPSRFAVVFAKHIALDFAYGEIGYGEADCAMNCLSSYAGLEFTGLPLEIYQAFDSGEYTRPSDPATVIPWQRYTLPAIVNILVREHWLPRA